MISSSELPKAQQAGITEIKFQDGGVRPQPGLPADLIVILKRMVPARLTGWLRIPAVNAAIDLGDDFVLELPPMYEGTVSMDCRKGEVDYRSDTSGVIRFVGKDRRPRYTSNGQLTKKFTGQVKIFIRGTTPIGA